LRGNPEVTLFEHLTRLKRAFYKRPAPAIFDLDRKLQQYLNFDDGFFIECGANDGYTQSNTYYLEKTKNWHGVLIEGIPDLFKRCVIERPNASVFNYALVASDYAEASVTMHYANLMSMVDGAMKSAEEQHNHLTEASIDNYTVDVPARTLTAVLDEAGVAGQIDFFSLDVEGYELSVLQGLDFTRYKPTYILVEARYFDEVNGLLVDAGYDMIEKLTIHDYLYCAADGTASAK
jgi:FkbM family methyltransferase